MCAKVVLLSEVQCPTLFDPVDCSLPGSSVHVIFQAIVTRVDCHFLLQGIFPTRGSNPGLLHYRQMLYYLSHREVSSVVIQPKLKISNKLLLTS